MRNLKFILDGKTPIPCEDTITWGRWFETADRQVANDTIGVRISTVFLGIDHSWHGPPPILFESMVFGGEMDGLCRRYSTWEEAEAGHKELVDDIKRGVSWLP